MCEGHLVKIYEGFQWQQCGSSHKVSDIGSGGFCFAVFSPTHAQDDPTIISSSHLTVQTLCRATCYTSQSGVKDVKIKQVFFTCDSISQHLPLSVSGSVSELPHPPGDPSIPPPILLLATQGYIRLRRIICHPVSKVWKRNKTRMQVHKCKKKDPQEKIRSKRLKGKFEKTLLLVLTRVGGQHTGQTFLLSKGKMTLFCVKNYLMKKQACITCLQL